MAAIFENFSESGYSILLTYPEVENFDEIALSLVVKEIEAILCFVTFGKNSKWPPFKKKFFKNWKSIYEILYPLIVEKALYMRTLWIYVLKFHQRNGL